MTTIINGRLILPDEHGDFQIVTDLALTFDEKILAIGVPPSETTFYDAENNFVAPGFINIHIHGAAGFDTMDEDPEALHKLVDFLPSCGVTSFLPTTMTMPLKKIHGALQRIRNGRNFSHGAKILGAHVEGPFISRERNGAQALENIIPADFSLIEKFSDTIKIITVAPEEIDFDFIDRCKENNIIVSLGHSAASYDITKTALSRGAKHITHLFNAHTGLHHREPGVVGAALDSHAMVELITDNIHVHPAVQRLVARVKPRSEIILVTDSLRACGLGDGISELGGQKVFVHDNLATLEDGTIVGSVATMNQVLKNFVTNTNWNVAAAVELVTKNPAISLDVFDRCGSLEVGKIADITIFDDDFNVKRTFIAGV